MIVRRTIQARLMAAPGVQQLPPRDQERLGRDTATLVAFATLAADVDFPSFVGALVKGVFEAIVDGSIRQMDAYRDLVAGLARSVDEFADAPARRAELAAALPGIFELCEDGTLTLAGGCRAARPARRRP